jgi:hypothetical protein
VDDRSDTILDEARTMNVLRLMPVTPRALLRSVTVVHRAAPSSRRNRRKQARFAVLLGFVSVFAAVVGFNVLIDRVTPSLRDPEIGRRLTRYRDRVAEHPTRPVVAFLGSSRVSLGVRPAAWEEVKPEDDSAPIFSNLAVVGGGPVTQVMVLRRLLESSPTPDALVLEYWPPFLRGDRQFAEEARMDPLRFGPEDESFIRDYFQDPPKTFAAMETARRNPYYSYRHRLIAQINPRYLKWNQRLDYAWDRMDEWGWIPGVADDPEGSTNRVERMKICRPFYRDQFDNFAIHPLAERAFVELITLARSRGIAVGLLFMPESAEFRAWYSASAEKQTQAYLERLCREQNVPVINARLWMPDDATCDGFHMFRGTAATFTQRLGPAVMQMFPDLKKRSGP